MLSLGCERWDSNPRFSPYEGDEIAASLLRNGCGGQTRTANLYLMRVASYHFSTPQYIRGNIFSVGAPTTAHERKWKPHQRLVPKVGIEPTTSALWGRRSKLTELLGHMFNLLGSITASTLPRLIPLSIFCYGNRVRGWKRLPENCSITKVKWRLQGDLNPWPPAWQAGVLTNWTMKPYRGSFSSCPGTQSDDWSVLRSGFNKYNHKQNPPLLG